MDKLAKRLHDDALQIEARVSEQLDARINASLQSIEPEQPVARRRRPGSGSFWWASSLTGIAAAALVIAVVNLHRPQPTAPGPAPRPSVLPAIKWHTEAAVLTAPLEQEYEDLRSDLERAEEAVKQDIERLF